MGRETLKTTCYCCVDGEEDSLPQTSVSHTLPFGSRYGVFPLSSCLMKWVESLGTI